MLPFTECEQCDTVGQHCIVRNCPSRSLGAVRAFAGIAWLE